MKELDYEQLNRFIASDVIKPFYETRFNRLEPANVTAIFKAKNPYLFKAKNTETAGDLAKNILDAYLSSQEETIFGRLMEELAIHICSKVFDGKKAEEGKYKSIDLIFDRDGKTYIVSIKSGPNWGNADQVGAMISNLGKAKKLIKEETGNSKLVSVNGCMYGRDNQRKIHKVSLLSYHKICGQAFWELISGDNELYKKIIQPLDAEVKKRSGEFKELYTKKINEMTKEIVELF